MRSAFTQMARVLPKLWFDRVKIVGVQVVDDGPFSDTQDVVIVEGEPAKISKKALKPSTQSYFGTDEYDVVMYIRQGIKIPAGSQIYVTDINGQTTKYRQSGKSYTGYVSHQEVALTRDEKAKEVASNGMGDT